LAARGRTRDTSGALRTHARRIGIGDGQQLGGSALSWTSPIGWAQQTRAYTDLRWWPLVLCFVGLAVVAYGLRAGSWWVWAVVVGSMVVGMFGSALNLPKAVLDAAPFGLVPAAPGVALDILPLVVMVAVAAALMALGTGAFRRRDLSA
jgi:ABC-2 type transport system permease protein